MNDGTPPNIRLRIGELVLDGLPIQRHQASAVRAALEAELSRLLAESFPAAQWQAGGAVRAQDIHLAPRSGPAQIGAQIARAIYDGIGRTQ